MKSLACAMLFAPAMISHAAPAILSSPGEPRTAPPPPIESIRVPGGQPLRAAATVYSIGDPTPEEQLYLEFINRARANPPAEGVLLGSTTDPQIQADYQAFQIDLTLMRSQFSAISPAQPLAMNPKLTTAARVHSQDMFANVFQDHNSSDGTTVSGRLTAVGYAGQAAENIYSNAKSVSHGHAAFEVDWGGPSANGGMQSPSGHRQSIHNPVFREVGIGVVLGYNSVPGKTPIDQVGPQIVTQDFGVAQNSTPLITGVAYYDLNGNGLYDIGEGIGNVRVTVSGSSYEAVTARSGGYAVPVIGNGNYTVTFSANGLSTSTQTASVIGSKNVKVDFTPTYLPPTLTGPTGASVARSNLYSISAVGGAADYEWHAFQTLEAAPEGAENDTTRLTITQTGTYDVIEGIITKSGSFAFHLITPSEAARSQYITLAPTYVVNPNSTVSFQSMLGFATSDQHAQVQVSADGGLNWTAVYNQAGSSDQTESAWRLRTASLSQFAGKAIRIRFAFEFLRGVFVNATDLSVGWLIDDIQFSNVQEITNDRVESATANTFTFVPATAGDYRLQARARTGHSYLDWGPSFLVHAAPPTGNPQLQLAVRAESGAQLVMEANIISGADPSTLTVESSSSVDGPWHPMGAQAEKTTSTQYRVTIPAPPSSQAFFRIRID